MLTTPNNNSIHRTDVSESWLLDDNIMYVHYFKNALVELDHIKASVERLDLACPPENLKVLVHMEDCVKVTREAREYLQERPQNFGAEAHVIPTFGHKIMFMLFNKLRKPAHPLKAFDDLDEALVWLRNI